MVNGLIGRKIGATQIFLESGERVPVTVIEAGPCCVIQKKAIDKDGYISYQLGFLNKKLEKLNKPLKGHFEKKGLNGYSHIKEFPKVEGVELSVGDMVNVGIFKETKYVDIIGTSKGKGFQGVVKRYHFKGGKASHGSMFHRAPGSIGASSYPSRVWKNQRMPGHMGDVRVTIQNLKVVSVREEDNILLVKGGIPGCRNSIVYIKPSVKKANQKKGKA